MTSSIVFEQVSLRYPVPRSDRSIKRLLVPKRWRPPASPSPASILALDGVDLSLHEHDRVGIVGRNGAGKSSLLRLIAGVYVPTQGLIHVKGEVVPLFQLGLGFHPELSVSANVIQAGAILGHPPSEMRNRLPEILQFSELESYVDLPLKSLSTGMAMRVAFATATSIEPQILLLDEVFSAGDANFRERAVARLDHLIERTGIVVMVSHSAPILRRLCNRVLWLHEGRIRADGNPDSVLSAYEREGAQSSEPPESLGR